MSAWQSSAVWREKTARFLAEFILPIGLFALLTGMLWVGSHRAYPKIYQFMVALPVLVLIFVRPRCLIELADSPVMRWIFGLFAFGILSLLWATPEDAPSSLITRPFRILLVFIAANEVYSRAPQRFMVMMRAAVIVAVCAAVYTLARFLIGGAQGRLTGYGALYNPLLASHVFGFFTAFVIGCCFSDKKTFAPLMLLALAILTVVLLATGSRTPLMAMAVTWGWLVAISMNRKALVASAALFLIALVAVAVWPDLVMQRGLSYRPQIWEIVITQIKEAPWIGHGFATPIVIQLPGFDFPFIDTHNLTLAVAYQLGIVGVVLWLAIYATIVRMAWKYRTEPYVAAISAMVVYGFIAGMTEGDAFLSRPKEHWSLVWFPIALFVAVTRARVGLWKNDEPEH